ARRGPDGALLFDYPAHARDGELAEVLSFEKECIAARRFPGTTTALYRAPHRRWFVPSASVSMPPAALPPAEPPPPPGRPGITFERVERDTEIAVESYRVLAIEKTFSPDVAGVVPEPGGAEIPLSAKPPPKRFETVLAVRPERRTATFPAGTLVVTTAQRAAVLAVYLLEPHSDDGFTRWEMLDAGLEIGGFHPVHRALGHGWAAPPGTKTA